MRPTSDLVDRTIVGASEQVQTILQRETTSQRDGFLQAVTPTITLLGVFVLLLLTVLQRRLVPLAFLAVVALTLAVTARLRAREVLSRTLAVPAMSAVVVAPQAVLVPGETLVGPITVAGATTVSVFVLRVFVCVSFVTLLLSTTRFDDVLGALERLGVPTVVITLVSVTHRYLLVFFEALARRVQTRRSRQIQPRSLSERWRETGAQAGSFFVQILERGEGVQRAARARGGTQKTGYRSTASIGQADLVFVALVVLSGTVVFGGML